MERAGKIGAPVRASVIDLWDDLGRIQRPFDLDLEWALDAQPTAVPDPVPPD